MRASLLALAAIFLVPLAATPANARPKRQDSSRRLPRPRRLDSGLAWRRDPKTGKLHFARLPSAKEDSPLAVAPLVHVVTEMVPVTCIVSSADGLPVPGLQRDDFRIFDNGIPQTISYFDASTQPASIALVIDASPSVLRDSGEMKRAADALINALAPLDQVAVVDFSAHTYLQLPFSDVHELIGRAVARISVRALLGDTGGSNIYEAVYLAAQKLFPGRTGRKAIVLLTDGQDSGLGLTLDPASAAPRPGQPDNRLTFDDVVRALASQDIQVFAVSTENRPKIMTPAWLAAHQNVTLISPDALRIGIPAYTAYLAELVRRAGGQLFFLNETASVAGTFRQIAQKIRAEYTLGFYPGGHSESTAKPGWHSLRVEITGKPGTNVTHRAAYYVPTP